MHELKAPDNSMMTQMTSLHEERLDFVLRTLKSTGARRVLDLGCGSGSLLYRMLADPQFESITGLEDSGVRPAPPSLSPPSLPSGRRRMGAGGGAGVRSSRPRGGSAARRPSSKQSKRNRSSQR